MKQLVFYSFCFFRLRTFCVANLCCIFALVFCFNGVNRVFMGNTVYGFDNLELTCLIVLTNLTSL